ncbi:hypothetical protein [Gynuella sunshinyii]|uniref:Chromosome segregation ATPase n=1 Tax=Gynuella sunshinyii YC6258 TaxID=1445510 RepID=A0A0C5VBU7_9GAMM|nr:hypothetical protein [Gynuella sunshinyii]AJQ96800.1 chromosome segregation ATPase [Gynuella sunshinyii YC6258]
MYFEPLTLFILGEILIVYIAISIFLFYRGRLYQLLKDLLKEMRRNRMLRETLNAKRAAGERAKNVSFSKDFMDAVNSGGRDIYTNMVEVKLQHTEKAKAELGPENLEYNPAHPPMARYLALRSTLLNMEKEAPESGQPDQAQAEKLLDIFHQQIIRKHLESAGLEDPQHTRKIEQQLRQLQEQVSQLEPFQQLYQDSQSSLDEAAREIEQLKSIIPPEVIADENLAFKGKGYADEIYRLKSEKFDLLETINKLKLRLEQREIDASPEEYIDMQDEQIKQQARYMKEADVCINLLEKELETVNKENEQHLEEISELKAKLQQRYAEKPSSRESSSAQARTENTSKLHNLAAAQQSSVSNIRAQVNSLKEIAEAQAIAEQQEQEIHRLEQSINESETCIRILENELEDANDKLEKMQRELTAFKELDQNADNLEGVVQNLIQDSKEMLECIDKYQQENAMLSKKLTDLQDKVAVNTQIQEDA